MMKNSRQRLPDALHEILLAEKSRARGLTENPSFQSRIQTIRQKYIVDSFLMPLYAPDGPYSRSKTRVSQFGNFLPSWKMAGKVFDKGQLGWIRDESIWFIAYLTSEQEVMSSNINLPEPDKIDDLPAKLMWEEITDLLKELNLYGVQGGGALIDPYDINDNQHSHERTCSRPETR